MIKDDISKLSENDIYSMGLFTLYSLTEIPDYRVLSELPYILDKKSLLKVCKYYGGTTIKIPTVEELETVMRVLLLYQRVNIEKKSLESALKDVLKAEEMPAANEIQCGNYRDLSLFGAKEYAKEVLQKGFSLNIYGE